MSRKCDCCGKPYATSSTVESKTQTLTKGQPTHVRIEGTPSTPITHPSRYRKFFKKKRQPTTARKLWKPQAKIEEDDEDD